MTTVIILTDEIRACHPGGYFSGFEEESMSIPDKPFIREILGATSEGKLPPGWQELLSVEDLQKCIETCIYFGLLATRFVQELFWKITETRESFDHWFVNCSTVETVDTDMDPNEEEKNVHPISDGSRDVVSALQYRYSVQKNISEPLRSELVASWGKVMDRRKLVQLGCRCILPTCKEVVFAGNLKLLRWLREEFKTTLVLTSSSPKIYFADRKKVKSFAWNKELPAIAAEGGTDTHLEILKYLHEEKCPWNKNTCQISACKGHLEYLRYAHENGCPWDEDTCSDAAGGNHLECLKYAHENGCPWNGETCSDAAYGGNLLCLKYAHENGCYWNENTCIEAVVTGHLACLQYANENGCPWSMRTSRTAAEGGHLECLRYTHQKGCPWSEDTCRRAAGGGHLACLQYAHENGCPWDKNTCSSAAGGGHLACLQYAHENGCPWDEWTCTVAARDDHLECLRYAHENGCSWNAETCSNAAEEGHLACLKYAHENGCPWNEHTCVEAPETGHLACLQYAHENGCPVIQKPNKKRRRSCSPLRSCGLSSEQS